MAEPGKSRFLDAFGDEVSALCDRFGFECDYDMMFVAFLRAAANFGFVSVGPINIEVSRVEEALERGFAEHGAPPPGHDDFVQLSQAVIRESRKAGRKRVSELDYLFAFMKLGRGLPGRVFGELGVSVEQVERALRDNNGRGGVLPRLLTPEEVADYLQVHVETVRGWIRSGRLPARRVAGLRALRIRAADVDALLHPIEPPGQEGGPAAGH